MKFSKLDLLTLLISLFLFASCKDNGTVGLSVDPGSQIQGTLLDTVTIVSKTVDDPAITNTYPAGASGAANGLPRYPLGYMIDGIFGTTTADLAMSVNLPSSSSYSFGTNARIDSAVLVIPFAGLSNGVRQSFYGDTTATYNITINQLRDNLSANTTFLSNVQYATGDVLGTFSASIKPTTNVKITTIVTGGPDTVLTVGPQLRIKLDPNLIRTKIMTLDSATLSTNPKFNLAFKGIKATAGVPTKTGGMMFLNLGTDNSNIEIYYKKQNATTATATDTVVAKFPMNVSSNPIASTVGHVRSKTITDAIASTGQQQRTYLQAMGGVRNLISFPFLKNLKTTLGTNIVISKAELVVDVENPADSIPFKIAPRLALYRQDISGQVSQLPDNNSTDSRTATSKIPFGGFYDATKNSYTFIVTSYIQDIFSGKTIDYGTYLAPTPISEFNATPLVTDASRVVVGSPNNTNNRRIRLNIYYVKSQP